MSSLTDGLPSALADNDVLGGIRLVSSLFAADLLAVHSSCTDLIDELTGYAWDPTPPTRASTSRSKSTTTAPTSSATRSRRRGELAATPPTGDRA